MTSLLSSLSGQFSRALLLSTLLPVVVFVLLALVLVVPHIPATVPVLHWMESLDSEWKLAAMTLGVVLLTALLYNLNGPVIRFYEGYPWCDSWLGARRTRAHRKDMESISARWRGLWTLLCDTEAQAHPEYEKAVEHWNELARTLNTRYPDEPGAVLPTRLGNVIRSFESYPSRQYKIQAITVWPRLVAHIDEGYAAGIEEAKSGVDFMLNSSLLCGLMASLLALVHLVFPVDLLSPSVLGTLVLELVIFGGLAYGFYLAAISRAHAWGMAVKGAFDLYRWNLLEGLGYRDRPKSLEEERQLWEQISSRLILSDLTIDPLPPYTAPKGAATGAAGKPTDVEIDLLRGVRRLAGDSLEVTIRVRNLDASRKAAGVTVTDTIPEGWGYEWCSASFAGGPVEASGANPYRFHVGDLDPGADLELIYRMVPTALPAGP
jgi:hypothetical protein